MRAKLLWTIQQHPEVIADLMLKRHCPGMFGLKGIEGCPVTTTVVSNVPSEETCNRCLAEAIERAAKVRP